MLIRVIIRRFQCSAILSSWFIKSIPKKNSFSNVKKLESEQLVGVRTYVTTVPEINKSSELYNKNEEFKDGFYYSHYISTDSQFSDLFFRKELLSENADSSPLFTNLREFNSKTQIVEEDLKCLLTHLETGLQNLTFYELLEAANLTFRLNEKEDINIGMWDPIRNCFDKEFFRRRNSLTFNEILMVHNVLNKSKLYKKFGFIHRTMHKLAFKVDKLTHPQFVIFLYHLKKFNQIKFDKFKFDFLNLVNERIPSLNQLELGLLSEAFLHIKLKFAPPLFQTVMVKVLNEIDTMDAVALKSLCKNLSKIIYMDNKELFIDFQEKLIPLIPKFKNHQLHILVYSGFSVRYLNMALYDEVMKRVKSDITNFTLPDISRFVVLNANFNVDDKEFLDMALSEFEKRDNYLQEHLPYIKFLGDLIHFQIYPKNLLEKVLSNEIFTRVMTNKKGIPSWASLKWNLEIEKPEFVFPEVDQNLYPKLLKLMKYSKFPNQHEMYNQSKLYWMLKDIFGQNSVCSRRISFIHSNCSVLRFDKNLKAQEIPTDYVETRHDFRIKPPCDDHIWVCIIPLHRFCYTNYDEKTINYITKTHFRQLSILGYKHIYITHTEWYPHIKNPSGQTLLESLIHNKLQEVIEHTDSEK